MKIVKSPKPPTWLRINKLNDNKRNDKIQEIEESIQQDAKINLEEPAIIHPFNTSILKIKNNGCVEGWTATDQGFRIDPNARTFNIFADGCKEHLNYKRMWATETAEFWAKRGFLVMAEEGDYNLYAKEGVKIKSQKYIEVNSEEKDIKIITDKENIIIQSAKKINIIADDKIDITSNDKINITSNDEINIKAAEQINVISKSDTNIKVSGEANISSSHDINLNSSKDINIEAGRNININSGRRTNIC